MNSKIQTELAKASGVAPEGRETITTQSYLIALVKAVAKLSDAEWDKLSGPAQDWYNLAGDAYKAKKDLPDFPDLEKPASEEGLRRRRASVDDEPAKASYTPAKGDKVIIITKKGSKYEGKVLFPDDKGELVIDDGKEEIGIGLDKIESVTLADAPKEEPETGRRRRAAEEAPPKDEKPGVGDDVEIETTRGTVKVGKVIELDSKVLVLKDITGDEVEYDLDRLKRITVKLKAKAAEEGGRRRSREAEDDKGGDPKGDGGDAGDSKEGSNKVTTRAREIICDNIDLDKDKILALVKKEFPNGKDGTIKLIWADMHKTFKMLRERKLMK